MIRWLRVVAPPWGYFVALAVYAALVATFMTWVESLMGGAQPEMRLQVMRPGLSFALVAYAIYRVVRFHPALRLEYRDWLKLTPWTSRKPLPFGPVHLVLQDGLILALVLVPAWLWCGPLILPLLPLFFVAYALMAGYALFVTGQWQFGYLVCFGAGLAVRLWLDLPWYLSIAVVTSAIAIVGLRRSLAAFPWDHVEKTRDAFKRLWRSETLPPQNLGWPVGRLAPDGLGPEFVMPPRHAVLVSLLVAWGCYALSALFADPAEGVGFLYLCVNFTCVLVPLIRLAFYTTAYRPPINAAGRIWTGRWIIRGYDQVLVAPLLALWIGIACTVGERLAVFNLPPGSLAAPAVAVCLMITLGMGPSLREWRLTGHHRISNKGWGTSQGMVRVG